jgi:hypothetical protein
LNSVFRILNFGLVVPLGGAKGSITLRVKIIGESRGFLHSIAHQKSRRFYRATFFDIVYGLAARGVFRPKFFFRQKPSSSTMFSNI